MNSSTLDALKESIAHWERLAAGTTKPGESIGPSSCALCDKFFWQADQCVGCPVRARVKEDSCMGTPYLGAQKIHREHGQDSPEFRAAAQVELDFLKSLLPAATTARLRNEQILADYRAEFKRLIGCESSAHYSRGWFYNVRPQKVRAAHVRQLIANWRTKPTAQG